MSNRLLANGITYGSAIHFNGTTQYAQRFAISSSAINNITYMCWVRPTSILGTTQVIFQHGDRNSGTGDGIEFRLTGTTGVFNVDYIFVANLFSGGTISAGSWYHLAFTRTSGTGQCWVNGVATGGTSAATPAVPTTNMVIGGNWITNTSTFTNGFNGAVDDVRVYNKVLSSSEITTAYNHGLDVNQPDVDSSGLVMRIRADESSGASLLDSTGNGNSFNLTTPSSFVQGVVQLSNAPARTTAGTRTNITSRIPLI